MRKLFSFFTNKLGSLFARDPDRIAIRKMRQENGGKLMYDELFDYDKLPTQKERDLAALKIARYFEARAKGQPIDPVADTEAAALMVRLKRDQLTGLPNEILRVTDPDALAPFADILATIPWPTVRAAVEANMFQGLMFKAVFPQKFDPDARTFFGGVPYARPDLAWPTFQTSDGEHACCNFIGQIDLAVLPDFGLRHLLPEKGIIYMFADMTETYEALKKIPNQLLVFQDGEGALADIQPPGRFAPNCKNQHGFQRVWSWEQDNNDQPAGSVFPKWEMAAIPVLQLGPSYGYQEILNDVETANEDAQKLGFQDADLMMEHIADQIAARGCEDHFTPCDDEQPMASKDTDGKLSAYAGFPANWYAVSRLAAAQVAHLELSIPLVQDIRVAAMPVAEAFETESAFQKAFEKQSKRKANAERYVAKLSAVEEVLLNWEEIAAELAPQSLLSDEERHAFWDSWQLFEDHSAMNPDSWKTKRTSPRDILPKAAWHFALDAMTASQVTHDRLPQTVRDQFQGMILDQPFKPGENNVARRRHQMFGSPLPSQGNDDWWADICLIQIDSSTLFDFRFGDANALQFWMSPDNLKAWRLDMVTPTIG